VNLSPTQIKALQKIAQAGGHGFGEYCYLSRTTAMALYLRDLIEVGSKYVGEGNYLPTACIKPAGLDALDAVEQAKADKYNATAMKFGWAERETPRLQNRENSSLVHKPYGWKPWGTWTDAHTWANQRNNKGK
jgi:hypothetical protein